MANSTPTMMTAHNPTKNFGTMLYSSRVALNTAKFVTLAKQASKNNKPIAKLAITVMTISKVGKVQSLKAIKALRARTKLD